MHTVLNFAEFTDEKKASDQLIRYFCENRRVFRESSFFTSYHPFFVTSPD
jgi:hypothetical protein